MQTLQDHKNQKNINGKGFMIVIIALALVLMGIICYSAWYINAEPQVKLGSYKGLTININSENNASDKLMEYEDEQEKINQLVLNRIVKNAKFSHIAKSIDERYEEFMDYYSQIASLYDYESVSIMAVEYYGYDSLEAFEDAVLEYSELSVKQEMVLAAIAKKEGLSVTDEVFNSYIGNYLKAYDYGEDEVDAYLEDYGKETVYEVILADYTLDYLVQINEIKK